MATREDLELARRLLVARVVDEEAMRGALDFQGELLRQGKVVTLERVLYAQGVLPKGSLAPLTAPDPLVSQPFSNYRLDSLLGEGGQSRVYGGVYAPNGTPVAVKVLDPVHALRPEFIARFEGEAGFLVALEHENIVAGYERGTENGRHFFTMDLVFGATVLEVIERRGRLTNQEALSITLQIARALEYLHGKRLLHRDVKPGNVMVDSTGRTRMIDLGLVRKLDGASKPGEEALTVGTVEYLSPEQARGRTDLDPRSDVYSLGLTLYHMVVGEVPFRGESDYEVMAKQVMGEIDSQKLKHRHVTPEIYYFIVKMTSKDRDQRYPDAAAAAREIAGYLPGGVVAVDLGTPPHPPPAAPPAPPRPTPRPAPTPRPGQRGEPPQRRRRHGR